MKKLMASLISVIMAAVVFSAPVMADVVTGDVGASASPGDQEPQICIKHRDVHIGNEVSEGINTFDYRSGLYAFTGEQIEYNVLVRDKNGALDIGGLKAYVGGVEEVIANPKPGCDAPCDGLGDFNSETDKYFHVLLTVESGWYGESEVKLKVEDSDNQLTSATHSENWFFNPAVSMDVSTSDGNSITFGEMDTETRYAHSTNKLQVQNTGEGGVNLWTFIAGEDLTDPTGAGKCPNTNRISIDNMKYRGWTGTQWQTEQGWHQMTKYDQDEVCNIGSCHNAQPVPWDSDLGDGNFNDGTNFQHILTNQGKLEVEFKLHYPMPCIGDFTDGTIYIFGKAI